MRVASAAISKDELLLDWLVLGISLRSDQGFFQALLFACECLRIGDRAAQTKGKLQIDC